MKFDENNRSVREAFDVIYNNMSDYMDRYNKLEEDIQNNYYSKDKILQALGIEYREQDLSEDRICSLIESLLKEKHRVEEELEQLKKEKEKELIKINKLSEIKVNERELKDMIIGMLE